MQLPRTGVVILLLVVISNLGLWAFFNRPDTERPWLGRIQGVSFSPYQKDQDPFKQLHPSRDDIERDLAIIREQVASVRTYTTQESLGQVPELAARHGLQVTAGAWLDRREANNEREIANLIRLAQKHPNVNRLIVGNEVLLRNDMTAAQLVSYIRRVREATGLPVGTAEIWNNWLKYPEVAAEVDFLAVHILPYWENQPAEIAVDWAIDRFEEVKAKYPGKAVMFGEIGWPSLGNRRGEALPSPVNQAKFVRKFLNLAQENGYDYFIIEAFDQPWKVQLDEGSGGVEAAWGLWDADRKPKFSMVDVLEHNPHWRAEALVSIILALLPALLFLLKAQNLRFQGQLFYAALIQTTMSVLSWTLFLPITTHMNWIGQLVWGVLLPAQLALLAVILINGLELTEMMWTKRWLRRFKPAQQVLPPDAPMVSIHLAIHNEPPEMVRQTLDALSRLDYPRFEVLVVDNNTRDARVWQPVQAHCAALGARFRFFHLPKWPGYKAGALNFALSQTHADAAVVGVIDSDYLVRPDWLRATVPYFDNSKVGFVQAPQDNHDWQGNAFKTMCNWEYNGFFQLGMVQRNEYNAIIQHGTMTLVRRSALDAVGGWDEHCICEDSELGLRLMALGYEAAYVNSEFGKGVTPDSFAAYKGQRFRWAYGAIMILRKHLGTLLSLRPSRLTLAQKWHFLTGWFPWFADALHLFFTLAALFWSAGLLLKPQWFGFPMPVFLLPAAGMFGFKLLHTSWLYRAHVNCGPWERIGAAIAGMSLTHTIARAIFQGVFDGRGKPFFRTPKGENQPALIKGLLMAWEEMLVMSALWLAAGVFVLRDGWQAPEAMTWVLVLLVQSIPYLAAVVVSLSNALPSFSRAAALRPATAAMPTVGLISA